MFTKFNVVVPSDSVCSLGKVCTAALRIRHHTVSLGVADRRCLFGLCHSPVRFLILLSGHVKNSDLCTELRIEYSCDGQVLV